MPRLALFDLDDTLVDRTDAFTGWIDLFLRQQGLTDDARSFIHLIDKGGTSSREDFFQELRQKFSLEDRVDVLLERYYVDYISRFVAQPATIDALRSLREDGWKLAVVTNGPPSQMKKLEVAKLVDEFDALCVSEIVGSRKPDIGIFEEAARRCGLPLDGWMVGDSPSADIVGGQRAQLRTIWMGQGRTWDESGPAPDAVVTSIPEAVRIIARS